MLKYFNNSNIISFGLPSPQVYTSIDAHPFSVKTGEVKDDSISGKYLIIATRHIIGPKKHETFCELASDSTNNGVISSKDPTLEQSKYR